MNKINDIFKGLAEKSPFLQAFFSRNLRIGSFEINMLLLIAIAVVLVLLFTIFIMTMRKKKVKKDFGVESNILCNQTEEAYILGETNTNDYITKSSEADIVKVAKNDNTPKGEAIIKTFGDKQKDKPENEKFRPIDIEISSQRIVRPKQVEPTKETKKVVGKYEILLNLDGYHFYLLANNGQLLYESAGYTTIRGAENGIETFIRAVKKGEFIIDKDKFGRYRYILNKRYAGENYDTKTACENSIKSVKYFYLDANRIPYEYDEKAEKDFEKNKIESFTEEIDWKKIEEEEKNAKPSGKFEIDKTSNGFHFYLLANNGQLLFSSSGYSTLDTVKNGLKNFKKAVYIGRFFVDKDKFGRFRFILRGTNATTVYIGESYTTKQACEKIIESTKSFIKTATVMPYIKEEN